MSLLEAPATLPTFEAPFDEWLPMLDAHAAWRDDLDLDPIDAATHTRPLLPPAVRDGLLDFRADGRPAGALLIRGVPVGDVPATPASPTDATDLDGVSEHILLTVARRLGHPVGYSAEHGGLVVQNLLPTPEAATRQTSTSSAVELEFHTETAFHPHRPRYLLLLCLRPDPAAATLLCSIEEVLPHLSAERRTTLFEPRFRTGVDESFGGDAAGTLGPPMAVLSGDPAHPTLIFDADLMVALDAGAAAALAALGRTARALRHGVVLDRGDLLVVDNHAAIHGRTAFAARFDGTDRWLQRSFVVTDLAASADERDGHVITTTFG